MEEQKAIEAQKKRIIQTRRMRRLEVWAHNNRWLLFPVRIIKSVWRLVKAVWGAA